MISLSDQLPKTTHAQLERICETFEKIFSPRGIILHGSAATAGFDDKKSDLDLLVIVDKALTRIEKSNIGAALLSISNQPHPIEISLVDQKRLNDWQYPCPHLLHYSEELRSRFAQGLFEPRITVDEDLAMHLVVARARGIDLNGSYPTHELPVIPKFDYLQAIYSDFVWAAEQPEDLSGYMFANACRTLAYLEEGFVLSKTEGITWCEKQDLHKSEIVSLVLDRLKTETG